MLDLAVPQALNDEDGVKGRPARHETALLHRDLEHSVLHHLLSPDLQHLLIEFGEERVHDDDAIVAGVVLAALLVQCLGKALFHPAWQWCLLISHLGQESGEVAKQLVTCVLDLRGPGPLKRLTNLAALYDLDLSTIRLSSKAVWDKSVKAAVRAAACRAVNAELLERHLPEVREEFKARDYLRYAGALGRVGVQYRWSILQQVYARMVDEPKNRYMLFGGDSLLQTLDGNTQLALSPALMEVRDQVMLVIAEELSGQAIIEDGEIPEAIITHVRGAVENLKWPNQSKEAMGVLLGFIQRVGQQVSRHLRDSGGASQGA